ncbi:MAG: DUF2459 domain-containing protein [Ignavibacteriaceae bacterium]|nr:DUF2459 domain-containing protein [Ignavibacteriaceae bacterium]
MKTSVIYPIIFFFLHTSPALQIQDGISIDELQSIYLIKNYWHTALVFTLDQIDTLIIPEAKYFRDYNLIDFGWGDEEFYQFPGFDSGLAFGALFYSTPSTLRIEGISSSKEVLFDYSEIVIKLKVNKDQLKKLTEYIAKFIYRDENGHSVILSEQAGGKIKFYRSNGSYHLFNTCNTWVAEALVYSGFDMEDNILLAEQLFNEAAKIGYVVKAPQK